MKILSKPGVGANLFYLKCISFYSKSNDMILYDCSTITRKKREKRNVYKKENSFNARI